jgi:hypothetical protein
VEKAQSEIDAVHSKPAVTLTRRTIDFDIVESKVLELVDGPWREHYPGEYRVDQEHEGVCDPSRDATSASQKAITSEVRACILGWRMPTYCHISHRRYRPSNRSQLRNSWRQTTRAGGISASLSQHTGVGGMVLKMAKLTVPTLGTASRGSERRAPMVPMKLE